MLITLVAFLIGVLVGWYGLELKGSSEAPSSPLSPSPSLPQFLLADTPAPTQVRSGDLCHLFGKDGTIHSSLTLKFKQDKIIRPHGKNAPTIYNWASTTDGIHRYEEV